MCLQPAKAGKRDEYEPVGEVGRAAARRQAPGDDGGTMRDPQPAAGADQERGVLPERGQRGQAGHGGHQARARHRTAGQGGDRGAQGIR